MKFIDQITVCGFLLFIYLFSLLYFVLPNKEFSEMENRVLAKNPTFTLSSLKEGTYMKELETYINDHFPFRDAFVQAKVEAEVVRGKTDDKGILLGDGLYEWYKKPEESVINRSIEAINTFSQMYPIPMSILLVPNSVAIYPERLPPYVPVFDQLEVLKGIEEKLEIPVVPIVDKLQQHKDEKIYYETDHHWTTLGAYYGYAAWKEDAIPLRNYNRNVVTTDFLGTYYSKMPYRGIRGEEIEIFEAPNPVEVSVSYDGNAQSSLSLYNMEYLKKKDKYSLFLDGNHALTSIKTNTKNKKHIVVFKDSYAHCFLPFLISHYEEITAIDLRYYNQSIGAFLKEQRVDEVLFLYNISTFSQERNIVKITM